MKIIIHALRELLKRLEDGQRQLEELDALEARLRGEAAAAKAHLVGLGSDQLAAFSEESGHFDEATRRKVRSLGDVQTKLDLSPGVRAKQRAEVAALRPKLRAGTEALCRHCENEVEARLKDLHAKLIKDLAPVCGEGTERLKAAVLSIVLKSDLEQWRLVWRERSWGDDPAAAAKRRIALAEQFEQGMLCPDASDHSHPLTDMQESIAARARF